MSTRRSAAEGLGAVRLAVLVALLAALLCAPPAAAVEFENSRFRHAGGYGSAMLQAWEKGRSSARASAFFVANRDRRLLVMTAAHVVGRNPVFRYRGQRATSARRLLREGDFVVYEVGFGGRVTYASVGKFHLARARPRIGQGLAVVGYPKGFGGAPMISRNCELLPKTRIIHPTFFTCADLDRWCAYARAADKSRKTCRLDAEDRRRGRPRQCSLPVERRATKNERHRQSTHAMNCAVRLGSSGGPVLVATSRASRAVVGMPSAVFARVRGPYPRTLGVGVGLFGERFKGRARRLGIEVR